MNVFIIKLFTDVLIKIMRNIFTNLFKQIMQTNARFKRIEFVKIYIYIYLALSFNGNLVHTNNNSNNKKK